MSDLLNTLGKKSNSVEGAGKASEPQQASASSETSTVEHGRGDDLLAKLGGQKSQASTAEQPVTSSAESGQVPKSASSQEEPTGSQTSQDWTEDSKMKEIKKLREENKAYRLKYQTELDRVAKESEARMNQVKEQMMPLVEAQKELERIKAEQEDKKRDLSEKLAHREARLAELQAAAEARQKEFERQIREKDEQLNRFLADIKAQEEIYNARVDEEISKVPEKFKELAQYLVKGAQDGREALTIIQEAKLKGMFEDKTVVVNHSVPGAADGARASKERLEEAERKRREGLTSSQKIGEALKMIKSGTPNNVFRTKN